MRTYLFAVAALAIGYALVMFIIAATMLGR